MDWKYGGKRGRHGGGADLVGFPVVGEIGGCDGGGVGNVASVHYEYVPGSYFGGDLMHCIVVGNITEKSQARGAVAAGL